MVEDKERKQTPTTGIHKDLIPPCHLRISFSFPFQHPESFASSDLQLKFFPLELWWHPTEKLLFHFLALSS